MIGDVRKFRDRMKELGRRCELVEYEGRSHAFFNHGRKDYADTVAKMDAFLVSLGYLKKPPSK